MAKPMIRSFQAVITTTIEYTVLSYLESDEVAVAAETNELTGLGVEEFQDDLVSYVEGENEKGDLKSFSIAVKVTKL